jgi:hypothetical protein
VTAPSDSPLPVFVPPDAAELARLEIMVQRQLAAPSEPLLKLLGHGEVTLAFAWPSAAPRWACKRLPPSHDRSALLAYADHVDAYMAALRAAGTAVLPTSTHVVESYPGSWVIFLCQPIVPAARLGPAILRARQPDADDAFLTAVLAAVAHVVSPRLAVDAQLSNWADIGGVPHQIDVSTPFTCDAAGTPELDTRLLVSPFPLALRAALRRWVVPPVLRRYHDPRQGMIDFVANLIKERLDGWLAPAVEAANRHLAAPISVADARAYYVDDARLWEVTWRAKTLSRAMTRLRGGTYQFLLPPRTAR